MAAHKICRLPSLSLFLLFAPNNLRAIKTPINKILSNQVVLIVVSKIFSRHSTADAFNAMPQYVPIQGYKQLEDALKVHDKSNCLIYMYFFGEKDSQGHSWCPDCVAVEETVETAFREYSHPNSLIYTVDVGSRDSWKDGATNKFRQPPFALSEIPTLIRWKGAERLAGDQLKKPELLRLFFDEAKTQSATENTVLCS